MDTSKQRKWLAACLAAAYLAPTAAAAEEAPPALSMQHYVEAMQPGWNLGNTFEASGGETSWGNPETTEELINHIASIGYKSIRIPITWNHRTGAAPEHAIQPEFLARMHEVVDWALDANLRVIINLHHDSHWIMPMTEHPDAVMTKFSAIWAQIADSFKHYPSDLSFEGLNEPRFSEDWGKDSPDYFAMLDSLYVSFHDIVRQSGGHNATRPLILSTLTGSPAQARLDELYRTIAKLDDPHLIATIHYYGLYPFSVNLGGYTAFNDEVRMDIVQAFDRTHASFTARGIPVIVGEFGLLGFDKFIDTIQQGEKLKFMEFTTYYAKEKGFTHMLWDNGQHMDRRKLSWFDEELGNLLKASMSGRSSTAATDSVYIGEDMPLEDKRIRLNLNGNELATIRIGDVALTPGRDYVLDGDTLTFKARLLEDSLREHTLGETAIVTAAFSAGADWTFHVIQSEAPKLRSVSQLALTGFSIPTSFNGDKLATMEATYAAGGNAGPDSWTSFKEFGASFNPSYDNKEIRLLPRFFEDLADGEIILKFHFWSGRIVKYTLVKEGKKIEGIADGDLERSVDAGVAGPGSSEDGSGVTPDGDAGSSNGSASGEADGSPSMNRGTIKSADGDAADTAWHIHPALRFALFALIVLLAAAGAAQLYAAARRNKTSGRK
ncbi:cellulase family glycosylhydrolase [Paenibacillus sp. LHD-117]|uniref:cellulase family glycosylhydrolase n=1 Tax=Paenibacillus sp. LHD-117 TaxID=3071412 RepID=UPI0027DF2E2B|nr:cellulase family glycosylhydrolase [Paenibacillus sp. LHD-117]MDQ6422880.1 cellulase family glycosylhydrolase [Paenibacillus sp. LHD-117]